MHRSMHQIANSKTLYSLEAGSHYISTKGINNTTIWD